MIDSIVNGIAGALYQTFQNHHIYSEHMRQGFQEPCFLIRNIRASQKPLLGNRFQQNYFFDIHYFPKENCKENQAIQKTALQLYDALEYISGEKGPLRGKNMYHEVVDDVLHFFIEYEAFGCREKEKLPNMQDLTVYGEVGKNGRN